MTGIVHLYSSSFLVRLYDVNTLQCFVSSDARDQHSAALTSVSALLHHLHVYSYSLLVKVNYSLDGRIYATSSKDGDVKVSCMVAS